MFGHTVVEMSSKPSLPMASSAPLSSADFAGTGAEPGGSALWWGPTVRNRKHGLGNRQTARPVYLGLKGTISIAGTACNARSGDSALPSSDR
jgi:hypothetical protein